MQEESGLNEVSEDLLLFLTRSKIEGLYSHMQHHPTVGWRNICRPTYSGDPRVSAPEIKIYGKPLREEHFQELLDRGYLDYSDEASKVVSVTSKGLEKSKEIRATQVASVA